MTIYNPFQPRSASPRLANWSGLEAVSEKMRTTPIQPDACLEGKESGNPCIGEWLRAKRRKEMGSL